MPGIFTWKFGRCGRSIKTEINIRFLMLGVSCLHLRSLQSGNLISKSRHHLYKMQCVCTGEHMAEVLEGNLRPEIESIFVILGAFSASSCFISFTADVFNSSMEWSIDHIEVQMENFGIPQNGCPSFQRNNEKIIKKKEIESINPSMMDSALEQVSVLIQDHFVWSWEELALIRWR